MIRTPPYDTDHRSDHVRALQRAAETAVLDAFNAYILWQPDGDWETFVSFVDDEGGPKTGAPHSR